MVKYRRPASQSWKTFLRNHASGIAAIDLFVVPTVNFKLLFGLVILRHDRRLLVHVGVTSNPTAEWISRQISEAFPWESSPAYLIRDRDAALNNASEQWALGTARPPDALRGRTDMSNV